MTHQSLEDINIWADSLQRQVSETFDFHQLGDIKNALGQLAAAKKLVDNTLDIIAASYAAINERYHRRIRVFRTQLPTAESISSVEVSSDLELVPHLPAKNVIRVPKLINVPVTQVYWVEELQQFVIRFHNFILRGNIGDIYKASHHSTMKITPCRYGSKCRKYATPEGCQFFHDPIETPGLAAVYKRREIRNFTNGSFIYTPEPLTGSNHNMRHIGSRSTFMSDVLSVSDDEAQVRADQTMHDVLVLFALAQIGKLTPSSYMDLSIPPKK